jgi:GntR family transcriptional regulator/MocR family aminotransferase
MTRRSGLPKYEYLHRCIRNDIRTGILPARTRLPSKRELSHHLGVSVSTVEQAYDVLVSEGYLEAKPGSGFYVCPNRDEGTYRAVHEAERAEVSVLDMKGNRSSQMLFPSETWARLMRRTLSERNPELFETVPFNGLHALRQAITANLYEFKGIYASPEQVVIGAGTEYLYGRLLQLFGSRCTIAIGDYGSKNLFSVSQGTSTQWEYLPVDDHGLCLDTLGESGADVVHVSPANHFPTGAVMSADRREQLLRWTSQEPQRYIIEDDYDSELRYSGRSMPALFAQDHAGKVIYLNTFSKTLVPSIRISYMVLPRPLMELYRRQLSFYSCTVSSFEQMTLAHFISGGYFERHIMRIATMHPATVGTHLLMHIDTTMGDGQIAQEAARHGMHLSMLSDYCVNPTTYHLGCVVINMAGLVGEQVDRAIEVLEDVFAQDIAQAESPR